MELFEVILNKIFMIASRLIAMMLFCWQLKRRDKFYLRPLAVLAVCVGLEFVPAEYLRNLWLHCLYNTATFLIITLSVWLCFREKYFTVLFCCIAGKCMLHIAEYLCMIIFALLGSANTYISIFLYALVYVGIYFMFARRIKSEECVGINSWKTVLFAFAVVIITDLLFLAFKDIKVNNSTNDLTSVYSENLAEIIFYIMNIINCFIVLCLQFGLLQESRMKREAEIIRQLRAKEQEQYEISQDTIKLIGIKHHDIKNMLESHKGKFSEQEINSLNKMIESYDIAFKTGNGTLDTVLTEKYIACKRMNIRLESIVNGEALSFMSDMDIYSLFLNALNNAIESADKLEDEAKRIIWLKIYTHGKLLFVQTQNYYNEEIVFNHNKQIISTKDDKRYHGYGLQSIKMIVENYGGTMSVKTDNKIFSLGLVIPIPER